MSFKMRLGSYGFEWNPDKLTIPETKKTVATVETFKGSAIFQWEAFLEGTQVELWWEFMSDSMYQQLRSLYLNTDSVRWIDTPTSAYTVYVADLTGKYFETGLHEFPYRNNVKMKLNLRVTTSAVTTTTV